ncbi:MAG TPA: hypothetical protein VK879_11220 [Candidatus Sulfomarinibacteraceae bacterium]|nr:hypothetical protein [Candidatus Sulfomarinibacteraceae bacterium]
MMRVIRAVLGKVEGGGLIWVGLLLFGVLLGVSCGRQYDAEVAKLPTTGFEVMPQFAPHYERYGPQLLGEPITGACDLAAGGMAQYFQRMRLEHANEGEEIRFFPLGEWARTGAGEEEDGSALDFERRRLFEETGFTVRDEFLDFYEIHYGEDVLGPPISPQLDEGGLRVQYFRNGRLEWHPDAVPEERVRVGSLGQAHYAQAAHDVICDLLARPVEAAAVENVLIRVATGAPILYEGEAQVVFAAVSTEGGAPVQGVMVDAVVGEGENSFVVTLGRTDEEGRAHAAFDVPGFEPGQKVPLIVIAYAADGSEIGRTLHSFETWW